MINIKEIEDKLHKEEASLQDMLVKRDKLNKKIETKQGKINELVSIIERHKYSEISKELEGTNISVEELLIALKSGNLNELQNKIGEYTQQDSN